MDGDHLEDYSALEDIRRAPFISFEPHFTAMLYWNDATSFSDGQKKACD